MSTHPPISDSVLIALIVAHAVVDIVAIFVTRSKSTRRVDLPPDTGE